MADGLSNENWKPILIGDHVQVISGDLAGIRGQVVDLHGDKASVLVRGCGMEVRRLSFSLDQLQKIPVWQLSMEMLLARKSIVVTGDRKLVIRRLLDYACRTLLEKRLPFGNVLST